MKQGRYRKLQQQLLRTNGCKNNKLMKRLRKYADRLARVKYKYILQNLHQKIMIYLIPFPKHGSCFKDVLDFGVFGCVCVCLCVSICVFVSVCICVCQFVSVCIFLFFVVCVYVAKVSDGAQARISGPQDT